jgi:hypothetical protein
VSIHPFPDANGRTCRLVADWVLQRHGLPPATYDSTNFRVAVFWSDTPGQGATPEQAVVAMTTAVERTLRILLGAMQGKQS